MEWIYRYNIRVSRDRSNLPQPRHFDVALVSNIQQKCDELGIHPSFERWDLPPETSEKFRSEEHTSELQSLMRISYAVFCLKKKKEHKPDTTHTTTINTTTIKHRTTKE